MHKTWNVLLQWPRESRSRKFHGTFLLGKNSNLVLNPHSSFLISPLSLSTMEYEDFKLMEEDKNELNMYVGPGNENRVSLDTLLPRIWPDRKYRKSIMAKAFRVAVIKSRGEHPHPNEPVIRRPPFKFGVYTLLAETPQLLRQWCQRNVIASEQLEAFLKAHWETILHAPQYIRVKRITKRTRMVVDELNEYLDEIQQLDCAEQVGDLLQELSTKVEQTKRRKRE